MDESIILVIGGILILYMITKSDEKKKDDVLQKRARDVERTGDVRTAIKDNPTDTARLEQSKFSTEIDIFINRAKSFYATIHSEQERLSREDIPNDLQEEHAALQGLWAALLATDKRLKIADKGTPIYAAMMRAEEAGSQIKKQMATIKEARKTFAAKGTPAMLKPPPNSVFPITNIGDLTSTDHTIQADFECDKRQAQDSGDDEAQIAETFKTVPDPVSEIAKRLSEKSDKFAMGGDLDTTLIGKQGNFHQAHARDDAVEKAQYMDESGMTNQPAPSHAPKANLENPARTFDSAPTPASTKDNPSCERARIPPAITTIALPGADPEAARFNAASEDPATAFDDATLEQLQEMGVVTGGSRNRSDPPSVDVLEKMIKSKEDNFLKQLKVKAGRLSEYIADKGKTKVTIDHLDQHLLELFSVGNDLYNKFPWAFQAASNNQTYKKLVEDKLPFSRYAGKFERRIRDVYAYKRWFSAFNEARDKYKSWQKKRTQAETEGNIPDNHSGRKRPRRREKGATRR